MLRFVVGFAVGWVAKSWLDKEIDKHRIVYQERNYGYMDALNDKKDKLTKVFNKIFGDENYFNDSNDKS